MKITDTFEYRLIIISPMNHFVFTPMLASAAVGTVRDRAFESMHTIQIKSLSLPFPLNQVEYRSMTEAVRSANPMATYIEGKAMDVDLDRKTVRVQLANLLQDTRTGDPPLVDIAYDQLVVAVGCKVADNLVPGASKYCMRLKTCDDARRLRNAVGECLEYALRPDSVDMPNLAESESERRQEERRRRATFCIVGGGPTGVELAGELSDFFRQVTKPRVGSYESLKDDIKLVLVEGSGFLLPPFDPVLRAEALKTLLKAGVDVRLNTFVKEVGDGYIKLNPRGTDQEEVLEAGVIVWAAGTGPVPFVEKLLEKLPDEAKGRPGRINVDPWLRCPTPSRESFGSILVMGDAAAFQDEKQSFLPQTAQVAGQQGAFAARLLCRGYDLTVTPPILKADDKSPLATWMKIRGLQEAAGFQFLNLGILAYLGGGEALSQIQIGDFPVLSYAGSISFALWRSVYLVKQVATRNRVLVTLDWFKSAIFGRDITRL